MLTRLLLLAGCAATVAGAPLTSGKLELIPEVNPSKRRDLARRMQPLMGKEEGVREALILAGVDEKIATRLQTLHDGPLLVERYSHGLVLEVPDLTKRQKEVLDHLHPTVLAGQFAIWAHRRRAMAGLGLKEDDPMRRRIAQSFDIQIRDIEKRYWRMIGFILTVDQRAALHPWMPQPYQRPPNLQAHVYQLPGMTASQASRIRALFTEYEAETGADVAELARLRRRASDAKAPIEERRLVDAATDRIAEIIEGVVQRGREILDEEQMKHLDALPPLITPQERNRHPGEILKQMGVSPEQQKKLEVLGERIRKRVEKAQREAQEKAREMQRELGSDSPQAMTMQMMVQGVNAEKMQAFEEGAHVAFIEIIDKKQILGWILSPR